MTEYRSPFDERKRLERTKYFSPTLYDAAVSAATDASLVCFGFKFVGAEKVKEDTIFSTEENTEQPNFNQCGPNPI